MKAEREDAPFYIYKSGWMHTVKVWSIPAIAGTFITMALLQLANLVWLNERIPNVVGGQVEPTMSGQVIRSPTAAIETERRNPLMSHPAPANRLWKEVQTQEPEANPSGKQTVFNDRNYAPRDVQNIVSMAQPQDSYVSKQEERKGKGVRVTIVGETRDFKETACWPFREGSIEKRNCKAQVALNMRNRN